MNFFTIKYAECRSCGVIGDSEIMDDDLCPECKLLEELNADLELARDYMDGALSDAIILDGCTKESLEADEDYLSYATEVAEIQLKIAKTERLRERLRYNVNG